MRNTSNEDLRQRGGPDARRGRRCRWRVFADLAVAVADGADAISGIEVLGDRQDLFGPVASMPTGACTGEPSYVSSSASVTPSTRPVHSAISRSNPTPACDTTPAPSSVTTAQPAKWLPARTDLFSRKFKSAQQYRHFRVPGYVSTTAT